MSDFCFFSSYGQNLTTSTFIGETSFAILIAILGLVLFAHLIGNMQVFLNTFGKFTDIINKWLIAWCLVDVDLPPISYGEARRMEAEATRHGGMDAASAASGRSEEACKALRSIQMACHARSQRGVDSSWIANRFTARYSAPPLLGPRSTCKFLLKTRIIVFGVCSWESVQLSVFKVSRDVKINVASVKMHYVDVTCLISIPYDSHDPCDLWTFI